MDSDDKDIRQTLRAFICSNFPLADSNTLRLDTKLLDEGIIDSLGLFMVVEHLEQTFGITISPEDVVAENFFSIETMAGFVERCLAGKE